MFRELIFQKLTQTEFWKNPDITMFLVTIDILGVTICIYPINILNHAVTI